MVILCVPIQTTTVNSTSGFYTMYMDSASKLYSYNETGAVNNGLIHTSSTTSSVYPDLIETNLGNILYPGERYILVVA